MHRFFMYFLVTLVMFVFGLSLLATLAIFIYATGLSIAWALLPAGIASGLFGLLQEMCLGLLNEDDLAYHKK